MNRWSYRPSKPAAIFTAFVCIGMLVFALTTIHTGGAFLAFWCVVVVGVMVLNLWSAFSSHGSLGTYERDDRRS
jgi:hypothetical protein